MDVSQIAKLLIDDFNSILKCNWNPSESLFKELIILVTALKEQEIRPYEIRRKELIKLINQKFDFNKSIFKAIIDYCAEHKIYFNYPEKQLISNYIDSNDLVGFSDFIFTKLGDNFLTRNIIGQFKPIDDSTTINYLYNKLEENSEKKEEILESLFGGYVFFSFDKKIIHNYFSNKGLDEPYHEDYFDFLKYNYPHFFNRSCSLIYLTIDEKLFEKFDSLTIFKNSILNLIKDSYEKLDNHSFFAVLIKPIIYKNINIQWELYSDVVLFSEKFIETKIEKDYFKPEKIRELTSKYIKNIDFSKAKFEIANEGFTYIDTFIISKEPVDKDSFKLYDILIIFEKNQRDERVLPCPACRSTRVQGNSYPKINVKSWECKNPFCPDKSKFNRGKRYSLYSLIRQKAIEESHNLIPLEHIRKWRLDIVHIKNNIEIAEMLLRHYSLYGDNVVFINHNETLPNHFCGRNINFIEYPNKKILPENLLDKFYDSPYFKRFMIDNTEKNDDFYQNLSNTSKFIVFCGDAFSVLSSIESQSIHGVVTSPPYYNAKEYSNWDNIYTYLYDMYNIAREIYRVLVDGGVFLFNIFDYFDNENNIAFSAMGKKRMILGAYIIYIFRQIGFTINGNIIWNKGEIEGKRNFNQGNLSPYYQAPLNAWEHIFVFSKGKMPDNYVFPSILFAKPVFKMVKKKNILGHPAPFPKAIPELLIRNLNAEQTVLDPFAGSFTTGRVAFEYGIKSINIDYKKEYCELGLKLFEEEFGMLTNIRD
ncbi:DNA-methyltransferase [Parageobacillus thermoglucosidasius]|uniref:DNA-methyltransferase n=1 Tax=Parageobacillus thermoglucosidasius TaxID=1426 RepID=UPI003B674488